MRLRDIFKEIAKDVFGNLTPLGRWTIGPVVLVFLYVALVGCLIPALLVAPIVWALSWVVAWVYTKLKLDRVAAWTASLFIKSIAERLSREHAVKETTNDDGADEAGAGKEET